MTDCGSSVSRLRLWAPLALVSCCLFSIGCASRHGRAYFVQPLQYDHLILRLQFPITPLELLYAIIGGLWVWLRPASHIAADLNRGLPFPLPGGVVPSFVWGRSRSAGGLGVPHRLPCPCGGYCKVFDEATPVPRLACNPIAKRTRGFPLTASELAPLGSSGDRSRWLCPIKSIWLPFVDNVPGLRLQ